MNRRAFIQTLAAATAAVALDPERLLWVPGRKTIFIPSRRQREFFQTGDLVTFEGNHIWGGHREAGGHWVFVRANDVRKLTGPIDGRVIGVVERVDRADVKIRTGGWANVRVYKL